MNYDYWSNKISFFLQNSYFSSLFNKRDTATFTLKNLFPQLLWKEH